MIDDRFFGHWTLTVSGRGSRVRLVLRDTVSVDGLHLPTAQPVVLEADGVAWRMHGERLLRDSDVWQRFDPVATSAWDPHLGLTRRLRWSYSFSTGADPGFTALVSRHDVTVDCWSHDPELAAVPAPDPPDFSVPEKSRPDKGRRG